MERYRDFAPTGFDQAGLALDDRQDWLVCPVSITRDTEEWSIEASNYAVMRAALDELDPDGTDHEEHTFGHWGPGWFSLILVRPGSTCAAKADGYEAALANYAVLDEHEWSNREYVAQVTAIEEESPAWPDGVDTPEDWQGMCFDRLRDHDQAALDRVVQPGGGSIGEASIRAAWRALGWLTCPECCGHGFMYPCHTSERACVDGCNHAQDVGLDEEGEEGEEGAVHVGNACASCPMATRQASRCEACNGSGEIE